jgi:hypothetical protein
MPALTIWALTITELLNVLTWRDFADSQFRHRETV